MIDEPTRPLTDKQELFCQEFIVDLCIKNAAQRSSLSYQYSRQLVTKSHIMKRISELKYERSTRLAIDQDYVLQRFHQIESFDLASIVDDSDCILPIEEWPPTASETIHSYDSKKVTVTLKNGTTQTRVTTRINLESRTRALESIAKHVGLFDKPSIVMQGGDSIEKMLELELKSHDNYQDPNANSKPD